MPANPTTFMLKRWMIEPQPPKMLSSGTLMSLLLGSAPLRLAAIAIGFDLNWPSSVTTRLPVRASVSFHFQIPPLPFTTTT